MRRGKDASLKALISAMTGRAVRRDVDPESQSADDAESRHLRRESLHEPVAHGLSVGRRIARADHRQTACRKGCRITFYV